MIASQSATPVSTRARVAAVLLALGTLAISVPAVGAAAFWLVSLRVTRQFDLSAPLGPGQRLVISAGEATLDVRPGPVGEIRVLVTDWSRVTSRDGIQQLQNDTASLQPIPDGRRLEVRSAGGSNRSLGGEIRVTVDVPADTPLEVTAGTVTARGLTGSFQISAEGGAAGLQDMTVMANSYVHAASTLVFSGLVESGNLELTSGFGGLEARLNRRSDARIVADTVIGDIESDPWLGMTIGGSVSKHGSSVMGPGTALVTLRTGLGNIRIEIN